MSVDRLTLSVADARVAVHGPRICGVYGLFDPADAERRIRYVGSTTHAAKRLLAHAVAYMPQGRYASDGPKRAWLKQMKTEGRAPVMVILEVVEGAETASPLMHSVERKWVSWHAARGWADLNRQLTSGDEVEHLLKQVKNLTQEIARLKEKLMQHATNEQHVAPCARCEELKTTTQRNGGIEPVAFVVSDRASLVTNLQRFADLA